MSSANTSPVPFIGEEYAKQTFRVLVVGESHYSSDDGQRGDDSDLTRSVVEARIVDGDHGSFFGGVEVIMAPHRISGGLDHDQRRQFWHQHAFINFVSKVLEKNSRPVPADLKSSMLRFRDSVASLDPHLICLFSASAWNYRPWGEAPYHEAFGAKPEEESQSITIYPRADRGRSYVMARFNHPRNLAVPTDIWRAWYAHAVKVAERC